MKKPDYWFYKVLYILRRWFSSWSKLLCLNFIILFSSSSFAANLAPKIGKPSNKYKLNPLVVEAKCPDVVIKSFKIVGKLPVRGISGSQLFKLKLRGVIQNLGNSGSGFMGEAFIFDKPQGARAKQLSHLRIQNLKSGKNILVGTLSQPLSVSTEFLPQYRFTLKINPKLNRKCRKKTKHGPSFYTKFIKPKAVLTALKSR